MKGLKIDAFCHVMPAKFKDRLFSTVREKVFLQRNVESQQTLWDMDRRRQIMDRYDGLLQIICLAAPPIEQIVSNKKKAADLARLANDEMAELVVQIPGLFCRRCGVPANQSYRYRIKRDRQSHQGSEVQRRPDAYACKR